MVNIGVIIYVLTKSSGDSGKHLRLQKHHVGGPNILLR